MWYQKCVEGWVVVASESSSDNGQLKKLYFFRYILVKVIRGQMQTFCPKVLRKQNGPKHKKIQKKTQKR